MKTLAKWSVDDYHRMIEVGKNKDFETCVGRFCLCNCGFNCQADLKLTPMEWNDEDTESEEPAD